MISYMTCPQDSWQSRALYWPGTSGGCGCLCERGVAAEGQEALALGESGLCLCTSSPPALGVTTQGGYKESLIVRAM